jgi:hypothetical protein
VSFFGVSDFCSIWSTSTLARVPLKALSSVLTATSSSLLCQTSGHSISVFEPAAAPITWRIYSAGLAPASQLGAPLRTK